MITTLFGRWDDGPSRTIDIILVTVHARSCLLPLFSRDAQMRHNMARYTRQEISLLLNGGQPCRTE